mmetsp:Transcript_41882/g.108469  ORF Transcript_41882/g.108469 Transcript_41882/m.108469 type:complete len:137 (-) Transcript_41882:92-502(-)
MARPSWMESRRAPAPAVEASNCAGSFNGARAGSFDGVRRTFGDAGPFDGDGELRPSEGERRTAAATAAATCSLLVLELRCDAPSCIGGEPTLCSSKDLGAVSDDVDSRADVSGVEASEDWGELSEGRLTRRVAWLA